jgi:hypothetical protein
MHTRSASHACCPDAKAASLQEACCHRIAPADPIVSGSVQVAVMTSASTQVVAPGPQARVIAVDAGRSLPADSPPLILRI